MATEVIRSIPPGRVLKKTKVTDKTGLTHDQIYRLARAGLFPKPIKISERASGWMESEVDAWISQRILERDQQRNSLVKPNAKAPQPPRRRPATTAAA